MTTFTKKNLVTVGESVFYQPHADSFWEGRKFVARFKHRGPVTKSKFLSALIKHYTPADYFAKMEAGAAPLRVLMDDGILVHGDNGKFILDGKVL